MTHRVVLATHNEHKVKELQQILAEAGGVGEDELGLEIVSMAAFPEVGEIPETEVTFAGNARLKAEHVAMRTSLPALADDSGLAVEVLGGSPVEAAAGDHPTDAEAAQEQHVSAPAGARASGEIANRDDVLRSLERILTYYARHEPSSPLPVRN